MFEPFLTIEKGLRVLKSLRLGIQQLFVQSASFAPSRPIPSRYLARCEVLLTFETFLSGLDTYVHA